MTDKPKTSAEELIELSDLGRNVSRLLLERLAAEAAAGTVRDPAGAARNAAVVAGIALDKAHALQDRPEPLAVYKDPQSTVNELARKLGLQGIDVDGKLVFVETAKTEIPPKAESASSVRTETPSSEPSSEPASAAKRASAPVRASG
jgi:hypothetical protein